MSAIRRDGNTVLKADRLNGFGYAFQPCTPQSDTHGTGSAAHAVMNPVQGGDVSFCVTSNYGEFIPPIGHTSNAVGRLYTVKANAGVTSLTWTDSGSSMVRPASISAAAWRNVDWDKLQVAPWIKSGNGASSVGPITTAYEDSLVVFAACAWATSGISPITQANPGFTTLTSGSRTGATSLLAVREHVPKGTDTGTLTVSGGFPGGQEQYLYVWEAPVMAA